MNRLISTAIDVLAHPLIHDWGVWRNRCNICQRPTVFVATTSQEPWLRRCVLCRSTPKYRAIYHAICEHLGQDLEAFVADGRTVYEMSTTSPIYRKLGKYPTYEASGYFFDKPFGIKVDGVWNQDVQRLSFADESMDVVISSETMEHVRDPWQGFREIRRVLRPGGIHVFTIPYHPYNPTVSRVNISGPADVYTLPKQYHQDPYHKESSLVYTDYGNDLCERLEPIGFRTREAMVREDRFDIQDDLRPVRVFVSTKTDA